MGVAEDSCYELALYVSVLNQQITLRLLRPRLDL